MTSLATTAMLTAPATAGADSLPARKAGLWDLKTAMDEGNGPREQSFKMCISDDMEANTLRASLAEHKANCETYEIKREAADTVVNARCIFNGRHVDSLTKMSGDFGKAFTVRIESTTSDQRESTAQTVTVKRVITQSGAYLGSACGDLQPGEAATPDGTKVSVQ